MKIITFIRNKIALLSGSTLFYLGNALADLPPVEQPVSGGGSGTYATVKGYLQDGLTLGGLVIAAIAFIVVANAAISCFHHVRQGKATWTEFGTFVVIGVILVVVVIWLVTKASDIL
ncbi:TIGR03745 family integrating conjugative element membrane protein [Rahnella sp. BCC 1045]|uniref:TIGR03745 family integrating conjugative element membrane protein n=1 Tax=Rahnella sp. BCC 1045 TaxID=2816251 RepID=UPI001C26E5C5|nr:TIGR03745 family integrating conjugative element membrane protein [Rahnella sp. BCC 1045]MBU9819893.1 TIGR03745 family integrating conjugative element membrane protein [Rahnella sp. BCC 1045]